MPLSPAPLCSASRVALFLFSKDSCFGWMHIIVPWRSRLPTDLVIVPVHFGPRRGATYRFCSFVVALLLLYVWYCFEADGKSSPSICILRKQPLLAPPSFRLVASCFLLDWLSC